MASVGVWDGAPSGVQGQSLWSGGQGGEAESIFVFQKCKLGANLPIFVNM